MPDLRDLAASVQTAEPAARFVPPRSLRRVVRSLRDRGEFYTAATHARCVWIHRDKLFQILLPEELGLSPTEPARLLLIPRPEEPVTQASERDVWRAIYHAAIDRAFDDALASGRIDPQRLREIRFRHGPSAWHAIRIVLEEESLVDRFDGDDAVLREFVAFASELLQFQPGAWAAYFPGQSPTDEPLQSLRALVDADGLFARLPVRVSMEDQGAPADEAGAPQVPAAASGPVSEADRRRVADWAGRGNDLRAAILLSQRNDPASIHHLDRLVDRLGRILQFTDEQANHWRQAIQPLLSRAAAGGWPVERRFLYELQRACLAIERLPFAADFVECLVTFGRRPVKRPLPRAQWVEAHRRLRAAARYAESIRLSPSPPPGEESTPHSLLGLIEHAVALTERNARNDLRPELSAALDEVGLVSRTVVERISRDKLVEELLDQACARGFLRIDNLRDAIARNRVKLPDLSGPVELVRGDPLIRANSVLPVRLDGVYRRGEIYMRLLQRGCSLFFGTRVGRAITKFVALPFGGAFIILEGFHHMVEAGEGLVNWLSGWSSTVKGFTALAGGAAGTVAEHPHGPKPFDWTSLLVLGAFLFLLIHWPTFRRRVGQTANLLFVKLPRAVVRSPVIRSIIHNPLTRFLRHYLLIPLATGALAGLLVRIVGGDWLAVALVGGGVALFMATYFRTPAGRELEDQIDEAITRIWRIVSVNFVIGLLTLVLQFFQSLFEAIDRAIYAVDELLRFREGQGRIAFALKATFGLFWFAFTYLFRFAWTLLVEPQINPIKHFPVVTVSHKMLLPLIPSLAKQFRISEETMGTIVFGIPGIFGFLVWELKENWKLYRANAPPTIRPAMVGSHGEKVRALLRPGFHSGVVPKTFAKLRKAVRSGNHARERKHHHTLEHVAEAVHRLIERDLAPLLNQSRRWGGLPIDIEHPELTPNRILLPILLPASHFGEGQGGRERTTLSLEERGGWVIASINQPGPLAMLSGEQLTAFTDALAGIYKLAGVHAIREQTATVFGPEAYSFDATPEGLIVPMPDGSDRFFRYDDGSDLVGDTGPIPSRSIVFSDYRLPWTDWAERWEADAAGKTALPPLFAGWRLLPDRDFDSSNQHR
jgi:hypothetical protein